MLKNICGREFEESIYATRTLRVRVSVRGSKISITLPFWLPKRKREEIIAKVEEKIAERLRKNPAAFTGIPMPKFLEGKELQVLGNSIRIAPIEHASKNSARIVNNMLVVKLKNTSQKDMDRLCKKAIARYAYPILLYMLRQINSTYFGYEVDKLRIISAKTVWGSCNAVKRSISINFALLFMPLPLLRYVLVHELAHLREQNHSKAFWRLVERAMPEYKKYKRQLRLYANA